MTCKLCGSSNVCLEYYGKLRNGNIGYTEEEFPVYYCNSCGTYFHNCTSKPSYYENSEYRASVDCVTAEEYFHLLDYQVERKFSLTGTSIFRNKVVADIGCGAGNFLEHIQGVASDILAIEPYCEYQKYLNNKKINVHSYADQALEYYNSVDVAVSFDVIEHVDNPIKFIKDISNLLKPGGEIIIGTPTEYPILRQLLGKDFDRFIFQVPHPWIFSERSLLYIMKNIKLFENIEISQSCIFGIGNCLAWLQNHKPCGDAKYDFISDTMNQVWKSELIKQGKGEYLLLKAKKINNI